MLKIVPDPPHQPQSLEDILIRISDHLLCASTAAKETAVPHSRASVKVLSLLTLNEIEQANYLVDVALSKLQSRH